MVPLELHCVECVKFVCSRGFLEDFIDCRFKVRIESFEKVFK